MSKYNSIKTVIDGIAFDSKKEAYRWLQLRQMEKQGKIRNLQRQVEYLLIPAQYIDGKLAERKCTYLADFVYHDADGNLIVEDVKGYRDPQSAAYAKFVIKRKLMLQEYGIRISEV